MFANGVESNRVCGVFFEMGLLPILVCSNDDPGLTLTYFTAGSNFITGFSIAKSENSGFFRNCYNM